MCSNTEKHCGKIYAEGGRGTTMQNACPSFPGCTSDNPTCTNKITKCASDRQTFTSEGPQKTWTIDKWRCRTKQHPTPQRCVRTSCKKQTGKQHVATCGEGARDTVRNNTILSLWSLHNGMDSITQVLI